MHAPFTLWNSSPLVHSVALCLPCRNIVTSAYMALPSRCEAKLSTFADNQTSFAVRVYEVRFAVLFVEWALFCVAPGFFVCSRRRMRSSCTGDAGHARRHQGDQERALFGRALGTKLHFVLRCDHHSLVVWRLRCYRRYGAFRWVPRALPRSLSTLTCSPRYTLPSSSPIGFGGL